METSQSHPEPNPTETSQSDRTEEHGLVKASQSSQTEHRLRNPVYEINEDILDYLTVPASGTLFVRQLLTFGRVNRYLKACVSLHPLWSRLGRRYGFPAPKPKARKYKTWKDIIFNNIGRFCELCAVGPPQCGRGAIQHFDHPDGKTVIYACHGCRRAQLQAWRQEQQEQRRIQVETKCDTSNRIKSSMEVRAWMETGHGSLDDIVNRLSERQTDEDAWKDVKRRVLLDLVKKVEGDLGWDGRPHI